MVYLLKITLLLKINTSINDLFLSQQKHAIIKPNSRIAKHTFYKYRINF